MDDPYAHVLTQSSGSADRGLPCTDGYVPDVRRVALELGAIRVRHERLGYPVEVYHHIVGVCVLFDVGGLTCCGWPRDDAYLTAYLAILPSAIAGLARWPEVGELVCSSGSVWDYVVFGGGDLGASGQA